MADVGDIGISPLNLSPDQCHRQIDTMMHHADAAM